MKALEQIKARIPWESLPKPMGRLLLGSAIAWIGLAGAMVWMVFKPHPAAESEGKTNLMEPGAVVSEFDESLAELHAGKMPASTHHEHEAGQGESHGARPMPIGVVDPHPGAHMDQSPVAEAHGEAPGETGEHEGQEKAQETLFPHGAPRGESGELVRQLIEEYARSGKIDKALELIDKALVYPDHPPEFLALAARILMAGGRYGEARKLALQVQPKLPQRTDLPILSAMALYRQGQVEEAMIEAMALLQKQPHDVDLLTALGTMHAEQYPDDPTADGYLAEALKYKRDHIPALYQVGRREMRTQEFARAEKSFDRILQLNPQYVKALAQKGMAYYYQEKWEPARKTLIAVLRSSPRDYNTWYNLGEVYLQQAGESGPQNRTMTEALRKRAFHCFNETITLEPEHAEAHYRLGLLLLGNNQPKEAIRHLEFALEKRNDWVAAWLQLALAYEALEQYTKARDCLTKAYALDPLNKVVALKLREWG